MYGKTAIDIIVGVIEYARVSLIKELIMNFYKAIRLLFSEMATLHI